ncbi:AAA family ATPase [Petroclostridium sp. X23]|uniref:AAA family ATPase n=1 Tax=Petroclostridium sp. X23 TaxID=3045146 RepID=UPI0024AC924F|nr:AAA family ATPase [Petroclostridium sp. X23]WHH59125.1 AAA family ATPase [Petroclostridium sp. X23]
MRLVINKLIMQGFKNHKNKVEYDFSDFTKATGENGQGKTTIGEGICWALFGANLWGNERADSVLVNPESKVTDVELVFTVDSDQHSVWRHRKGSKTDIYLDDKKVTNNDLAAFYKDKRVFYSIFNPAYFPALTPKDAKELLMEIIPDISTDAVMKELDTNSRDILANAGFRNADLFLQERRELIKEVDEELLKKQGFLEGTNTNLEIPEEVIFDDAKLMELRNRLEEIQEIKLPYDINALKEQKLKLTQKMLDIKNKNKPELRDISEIQQKINHLEMSKNMVPCESPRYIDVMSMEEKLQVLGQDYNRCNAKLKKLSENPSIECPSCGHEIDLNDAEKNRLKDEMQEIVDCGNELRRQIDQGKKKNEAIKNEYSLKIQQHVEDCEAKIKQLKVEIIEAETYNQQLLIQHEASSEDQITEIKVEIDNLMIEERIIENENVAEKINIEKGNIRVKISELELKKTNVNQANALRNARIAQIKENEAKLKEAKERIAQLKKDKEGITAEINSAINFNTKKLDIQTQMIDKYLDKVSLKLYELVKSTGELKGTFKLMYEGREFQVLSGAERIKAGLEISNLIINLLGLQFPIFIDNAESITHYSKPDTQIIESRVVEGQKLMVQAINKNEEDAA